MGRAGRGQSGPVAGVRNAKQWFTLLEPAALAKRACP